MSVLIGVGVLAGSAAPAAAAAPGEVWTARAAAEANIWHSVTYGDGLYVAVAFDGTNQVMTSPDGVTWTARSAARANPWRSVTYGNGLFVAVSDLGSSQVMTSPDGVTWTARGNHPGGDWVSVTYGDGLFVAVAYSGTNRVMTSADGVTWTARSAAAAVGWQSVTYGDGLFVAVSRTGTNRVMTSPDGVTWTARSAAEASEWFSVTYGNGSYVAVARSGTNRVMTSPDGVTWTARAVPEANVWRSVTYGNGSFVAVSEVGSNQVMTSPDGVTWTARSAAEANVWLSVTYGDGLFVAVGFGGTNRVMTSPAGPPVCLAGTFSATGSEPCTPAPLGSFVPLDGATSATPAPAGFFVDQVGASSATACSVGRYQPDVGQTSCLSAPLGTFVDEEGASSATRAPAGFFVDQVGASSATACAVGRYQSDEGQISCVLAPTGTFVDQEAATEPTPCPAGTYQPEAGQASCRPAALATGDAHSCTAAPDGVRCWGRNDDGQLGDGSTTGSANPVEVATAGSPLDGAVVVDVSAGAAHSCALTDAGTVACWGGNARGQLGNGSLSPSSVPVAVAVAGTPLDGEVVSEIVSGADHTCARTDAGAVACWGGNTYGGLGDDSTTDSELPVGLATAGTPLDGVLVTDLDAGRWHTCAAGADGSMACWGLNSSAQFGNRSGASRSVPTGPHVPGTPLDADAVAQVAAGRSSTCAVTDTDVLACWGANDHGQLGYGTNTYRSQPTVATLTGTALDGEVIEVISAGDKHVCSVTGSGEVACWGLNNHGQVGDGTTTDALALVAVDTAGGPLGGMNVTEVSAGFRHSCAVAADGTVACWGYNADGQLGNGTTTSSSSPVETEMVEPPPDPVVPDAAATPIAAGDAHTCAIDDGDVSCWGRNDEGQLGDGTTTASTAAVAVDTAGGPLVGGDATDISAGTGHTCAVVDAGGLACWGGNDRGQLGDGTTTDSSTPVAVEPGSSALGANAVIQVVSGADHSCALTDVGEVACWGANTYGALGDNTTADSSTPVDLATAGTPLAGKEIASLASGRWHTCARSTDGVMACWGLNSSAQIGNRSGVSRSVPTSPYLPGTPLDGAAVTLLAAGRAHTCAVTDADALACWGANDRGQLGYGNHTYRSQPTTVDLTGTALSGATIAGISAGDKHVCATTDTGEIACWGLNNHGQIGDGTAVDALSPVSVATASGPLDGKTVTAVAAGFRYSCALADDGTVACWGLNADGQLGDGSTSSSPVPTA